MNFLMTIDRSWQSSEKWTQFCDLRVGFLSLLAETVEQGFTRRDTKHPAFCGCIDWHSSVHGAYALLIAARLTGQSRWAEIVDASLTTDCLDAELASLQKGGLEHELPYGYAWFLKLAMEREQGWGKTDLLPLAAEIALRLEQWIFSLSAGEIIYHAQRREYGNLSWALLNVWGWAQWKEDVDLSERLRKFTRTHVVSLDEILPPSYDNVTNEFFAASLQRTRTILTILPKEESLRWLESFYLNEVSLEPTSHALTPHSAGLNFSRAWGFWTLFACTGKEIYRQLYVDHVVTHMNLAECWRNDYRKHAHWVPQFGIYAIALSMEKAEIRLGRRGITQQRNSSAHRKIGRASCRERV